VVLVALKGFYKPDTLTFMTAKQKVMKMVRDLPANASIEDAMERLLFLAKIEKGLEQADAGQTIPHAKVKEKMSKWLK
jgi:predicted transcriptional regulator